MNRLITNTTPCMVPDITMHFYTSYVGNALHRVTVGDLSQTISPSIRHHR
jgi:hypothetical protein